MAGYRMTMYDVLSDSKRDALFQLLKEQLARVTDKSRENSNIGEEPRKGNQGDSKFGIDGAWRIRE